MTERKQIYKCLICGNIVEVLHTGQGELVCCNQPMSLIQPQTQDLGFEKHVPIVEQVDGKFVIRVGEEPHPMKQDHFIEWVEVIFKNGKSCKVFLNPGQEPTAVFISEDEIEQIREYCNLHGLWVNKVIDKK